MSDRIRILHVITSLAGGAGAYVYDLAKHTDPARFDVQLAFGPGYPLDDAVRRSGIQHHELSWKRSLDPIATLRGAQDVSRLIRSRQPDILHVHCSLAGVVGCVLGRWHKVPNILFTVHVLASHDYQPLIRKQAFLRIERAMDRFIDLYIVGTRLYGDAVVDRQITDWTKINVIPLSVPVPPVPSPKERETARQALGLAAGERAILAVGRMEKQKGLEFLIRAMPEIVRHISNARLVILGDGPMRGRLESITAELNLGSHVTFAGWRDDTRNLMSAADVFCLSSLWESFGYVVLEAMAAQVPVVATRVDGVPEVVDFGRCAELVGAGKPEALAAGIVRVLSDPDYAVALARTGRTRVETEYSDGTMVRNFENLYLELARKSGEKAFGY